MPPFPTIFTGRTPAFCPPVWGRSSRLILTSAKEDITLTVFEYSPERIYCTYRGQTYAFLAAGKISDADHQPFDYFFEWFDDVRYDAMPLA